MRKFSRRSLARSRSLIELLETRCLLSTTYYVSPGGSDANAGTSQAAPWASVAKVDASTFSAGDNILFQYGGEWHGLLVASSSGTAANPITYGAYGTPSAGKPIFDGSDVVPAGAFTQVSGTTDSFPVSAVSGANGNAYWVYANHVPLLAATSLASVEANANSFFVNGATVDVNVGTVAPGGSNVYTLGDRGAGTAANSSLIDSNGQNNVTFANLEGRETAETAGGGNITNGSIPDGYVFRIQGGSNITLLNDDGEYGSKHIFGAIDTTGFVANGISAEGAINGVSGNQLGYGNITATVAYSDSNQSGDTYQWINTTVSNYDGGQPAFLSHADATGDITTLTLQNFVANGSQIVFEPVANETISVLGGSITNNTLVMYGASGANELINGMTFVGSGSAAEIYGGATLENSLFEGSSQSNQAIQVSGAGNLVRFNTIVPPSYGTAIALEGGETGANIYGNLISGTTGDISVAGGDTYTADYNFFDSAAGTPNAAANEPHSATGNPQFAGSTASNPYALTAGSPAINLIPSGTSLTSLSTETTDLLGQSRPNGGGYDAGAYEYQLATYPPTVATAASATPNPVTGTTTNLSVLGADQAGENNLTYTWAATTVPSGAAAPTFSANGTNAAKNTTATFSAAGTYVLQATIADGSYTTTSSVTVNVTQVATALVVTPQPPLYISVSTTKQFTATVTDQFGKAITNPAVVWTVTSGAGTISNTGLYTAPSTTGSVTITATDGSVSNTVTFTVAPPNQAPTVATAAAATPNPVNSGATAALSVLGADDNGEANLTYTWSLTGTVPASVGFTANGTNAAKNTTATFTKNGTYNFLVTITDSGGLSTTSTVTVTVNSINPITVDGSLDGSYGPALATQTVTTNVGSNGSNGVLGGTITAYTQLSAAYGVINESTGYFYLFLAGSLSLNNQHLNLLLDSVPGQGVTNLNALSTVGPYNNGSGFADLKLDAGFDPDYIFSAAFGTGTSINYYNFDTGATASDNVSDPSTTEINTGGSSVPLFYEKVNNAAASSAVSPANAGSLTTGAEFAFSLAGLNYTAADYAAGDGIGVMALVTFASFTQFSNQSLAPLNETAAGMSANGGSYFQNSGTPTDFSNAAQFPGNQFFSVGVPTAGNQAPTVATAASASPNPVTGTSTAMSVLGADDGGESNLTYTWSVLGTPPSPVTFTANGTNAAKNTTARFTATGTYNFLVTITDAGGLSTTSSVTVNATVPAAKTSTGITLLNNGSATSNATQALSYTATITGGVPAGETVTLEDASNANAVVATASVSGTTATFTVPAGALLAGTHNLFAVYAGDASYAASSSTALTQTVQVVVTAMTLNGNIAALAGVQRSMIDSVVYSFSEAVNLGANAFAIALHPNQTGTVPTLTWTALSPAADGSSSSWVVTFSGAGVVGNSIADGVYDLTMNAPAVTSDHNPAVTSQAAATETFARLFGDINGDGLVNNYDYAKFGRSFGASTGNAAYVAAFDYNGDGVINNYDYAQFGRRFGKSFVF